MQKSSVSRIDALIAAYEWLGTYEDLDGTIDSGGTEGVPEDMLAGYAELRRQINALYAASAANTIANNFLSDNPDTNKAQARAWARAYVKKNRDKFAHLPATRNRTEEKS